MTFASAAQRKAVFAAMYRGRKVAAFTGAAALVAHPKTRQQYPNLSLAGTGALAGVAAHVASRRGGPLYMLHLKNASAMGKIYRRGQLLANNYQLRNLLGSGGRSIGQNIGDVLAPAARSYAATARALNVTRAASYTLPAVVGAYALGRALYHRRKRKELKFAGMRTGGVQVIHKPRLISTPTTGPQGRLEYRGVA